MRKALLASDDVHTRAWVKAAAGGLELSFTESTAGEAAALLADEEYDLAVLDAGHAPEAVLHELEAAVGTAATVRVLVLVEPDALAKLRLPVGMTSDFLVRGASSEEAGARIRALVWPGEEVSPQELVRVGDLTLNLATYQAYRGGEPIDFTYLEYVLFAFLVTHPNRAYSREMLLRRVWGTDYYGGARTVDVHVRRIRAKIGPELSGRLDTVRNVGYLWRS